MKSLRYLIISIVISITLISAVQKSSGITKSLILQSIGNNVSSVSLNQSADIMSSRLKLIGLNSFEVKVSADKGQVMILMPDSIDISEIERLVTSKGDLSIYETYSHNEIMDLLKPDNQLFKLLNGVHEKSASDPRVGCTPGENRKKTVEYLQSGVHFNNCKFFWGFKSEKSAYCLFALKTSKEGHPLLGRSDIESVKIANVKDLQDSKIQIKLKPDAISVFADATKINLNKAIAIVIDDKVYSWPVVRDVINGGEIEITGNFSEKEAKYLPALLNSEQLPLNFKILN
jgi:preprotein translocase subunit SecD